jgi:hypothetical protein
VERFKLAIVLKAILQLEDLDGEPEDLVAMREPGGLDVDGAAGELLRFGVAARELQVDEGVVLNLYEPPALALEALDLALGLADLASVVLTEGLGLHTVLLVREWARGGTSYQCPRSVGAAQGASRDGVALRTLPRVEPGLGAMRNDDGHPA